jgi:hypothetical protein
MAEDAKPQRPTEAAAISEMNLWQKLAAITGEIGIIAKDGRNKEQNYAFIEYAAIAGRLRELYAKYHVVCIPKRVADRIVTPIESKYGQKGFNVVAPYEITFRNADKPDEVEVIRWEGEASDYGDKATNKAATAAVKYCEMRVFHVSEKGEDPDETRPDPTTTPAEPAAPKKVTIQDAIARAGAELQRKGIKQKDERLTILLKIAGVSDIKDLKPGHMNRVLEVIADNNGPTLQGYLDVEQTEEVPADGQDAGTTV